MTGIEPELWVDRAGEAVRFYELAFGAVTLHRVGEGDDIVVQLGIGAARFWVASAGPDMGRFSPDTIGGRTSRTLLLVDDPAAVVVTAARAGAVETSPVGEEHGWRIGRIVDPFGHQWTFSETLADVDPSEWMTD